MATVYITYYKKVCRTITRGRPTAAHTIEDIEYTINAFKSVRDKFESDVYRSQSIPHMADPDFKLR